MSEAAADIGAAEIAVVIVNYRTKELTAAAVQSVVAEPGVREIVIVDNASGDGSVEYLRARLDDRRVDIVEAPANLGFGQGVNVGARRCSAPLLFVLNSDATVVQGSLPVLARTLLENPAVAVVAPAVYEAGGQDLQPGSHGVFPTLKTIVLRTNTHPPETLTPDWVSGVAMMMRRQDFQAIGGFDPEFQMYMEDVDLCRRFRATGKEIRRELRAGVVHLQNRSSNSTTVALDQAHRSRVAYFRKAGHSAPQQLAVRALRHCHLLLQRTPFRRSFPHTTG